MEFIEARNYTRTGTRRIDLIVLHDMEAPERTTIAESLASWAAGPTAPQASWHYAVDSDTIVQSVRDGDVAWHAPGANHNGIGIEHAGYARQSRAEWLDVFGKAMLERSAEMTATLCRKYRIPLVMLDSSALLAGKRGITTHAAVSGAWHRSDHHDPGHGFPADYFLERVRAHLTRLERAAVKMTAPRKVTPAWGTSNRYLWLRWKLGEGEFSGYGPAQAAIRPKVLPARVPAEVFEWAEAFLARRNASSTT